MMQVITMRLPTGSLGRAFGIHPKGRLALQP
jgi:hypothetical protein